MTPRRALLLPAAAVLSALALTACSPTNVTTGAASQPRTVSVSATGQADVVPDAARATLTVEVTDPASAEAAQQAAAASTTKVLAALTAAGIAEADVATQGISVGPVYNYTSDGGQTQIGFRATQSLTVTLRDLTTAGANLDAVVAAGGNDVRVDSLTPFVIDPSVAANKARAQAVDIAQAQAEQYAQLLGFTLGPVATVSESSNTVAPPPIAYSEAAAAPADKVATPISAGTTQVSVTLNVAWSIEG